MRSHWRLRWLFSHSGKWHVYTLTDTFQWRSVSFCRVIMCRHTINICRVITVSKIKAKFKNIMLYKIFCFVVIHSQCLPWFHIVRISNKLSEVAPFCLEMSCLRVAHTLQGQSPPSSWILLGHWYSNHCELVVDEESVCCVAMDRTHSVINQQSITSWKQNPAHYQRSLRSDYRGMM